MLAVLQCAATKGHSPLPDTQQTFFHVPAGTVGWNLEVPATTDRGGPAVIAANAVSSSQ